MIVNVFVMLTIAERVGLIFVSNRHKKPTHQSLVPTGGLSESNALVCNDAASNGKRHQAGNPISKAIQLKLFEPGIPCLLIFVQLPV